MSIWDKLVGGKPKQTADSPELIRKNISDGTAVMLDVRSQGERDDGYLKDSIFIPITEIKELSPDVKTIENLPKEQVIYCHWKAGGRAAVAAKILEPMGYEVRVISDSYETLVEKGFAPAE